MAEIEEELKSLLMRVKEENEKASLFSPITACQTDGEEVEAVTDFIFLGSKITMDSDCNHKIKRFLLLGKHLESILNSKDIILPTRVRVVKAMVFPVVMYRCESLTIKKAEYQRIEMFLNYDAGEDF